MSEQTPHILLVDDEPESLILLKEILLNRGFAVTIASNGKQALEAMSKSAFTAVITDLLMPGSIDGIPLLQKMKEMQASVQIIVVTGHGTINSAVEAMKAGAYEYITKPVNFDHLMLLINRIIELRKLQEQNRDLQLKLESKYQFEQIIGRSSKIIKIFELIKDVATVNSTVLIRGEHGTGKELIANAIYKSSHLSHRPIVRVNCAAFAEQLLESELFGHVEGAFTGAIRERKGRFELADNGTIFLDEIGEISHNMQLKLLRVLQEGEFEKVGSSKTIKVNVRVIAATNKNLEEAIANKQFREDLYFRLNVIPIDIPPLRERLDDIPLLVDHFIAKYNTANNKSIKGIKKDAEDILMRYNWPGNVRELENLIERAVALTKGDYIEKDMFSHLNTNSDRQTPLQMLDYMPLTKVMETVERELIEKTYQRCGYNQTLTAARLGIHRTTFLSKLVKLDIPRKTPNDGNGRTGHSARHILPEKV